MEGVVGVTADHVGIYLGLLRHDVSDLDLTEVCQRRASCGVISVDSIHADVYSSSGFTADERGMEAGMVQGLSVVQDRADGGEI